MDRDERTRPNDSIPPHSCEALRCACLPCLSCASVAPVLCCSQCTPRRHPTWTVPFEAAVSMLRASTMNISRSYCALRFFTDPPIGVMPIWLPNIPRDVGCANNTVAPHGGSWFWPATGPRTSCCCCCPGYPGHPQRQANLQRAPRVILYCHGGAFALCSSKSHRGLIMKLVHETGATVLCPDYRRPPEHPWPTPVNDCLETYDWLLNHGHVDPRKIIFAGDSAGGGLVLAVMSAAKAAGLPLPSGGVLWSPWVDLTDSCSGSWTTSQRTDFLPRDLAAKFALGYAGTNTLATVSPGNVDLAGFPPLLIEVGECECLHDQVVKFAHRANALGVSIDLHVATGMVHVFPLLAAFTAADAEPNMAFKRFGRFVDTLIEASGESTKRFKGDIANEAKSK